MLGACGSEGKPDPGPEGGASEQTSPPKQGGGSAAPKGKGRGGGRPNLVVIVSDDQRADSLGLMPKVQRQIVARGTEFTQAIATTPLCCPSRATFVTGQYAHNHRVRGNDFPLGGYPKLRGEKTLPVWLDEAGYRTGHVGRYLNEYGNEGAGTDPREIPPGWDQWFTAVRHTEFRNYDFTLNENGELRTYGSEPEDYSTDVYARKARKFIRESADRKQPFYLAVDTHAPHLEGVIPEDAERNPRPAPRHIGRFEDEPLPGRAAALDEPDRSDKPQRIQNRPALGADGLEFLRGIHVSRLESLLAIDDLVGDVIGELRRSGELGNTVVVYTSDNGFLLGEHRLRGKGEPYEEALRIPLAVRGPGFGADAEVGHVVGNIDVPATFATLGGAEPDLPIDGLSLARAGREALAQRPGVLFENFERPRFKGVRTDGWSLIDSVPRERELYEIASDPAQLEDVAGRPRQRAKVRELADLLGALEDCSGRGCSSP